MLQRRGREAYQDSLLSEGGVYREGGGEKKRSLHRALTKLAYQLVVLVHDIWLLR